jgi:hypothetical protein
MTSSQSLIQILAGVADAAAVGDGKDVGDDEDDEVGCGDDGSFPTQADQWTSNNPLILFFRTAVFPMTSQLTPRELRLDGWGKFQR